jgi:hypothetical protein
MSDHLVTLMLKLNGERRVVAVPSVIGVKSGDVVKFKSNEGDPHVTYDPPSAVKLDSKQGELITVLQAPFKFFCNLKVGKELYPYGKGGGIGLPDPPDVTAIDPSQVARGSSDTVITVSGTNFCNSSIGLVNGSARFTVFESSTSIRITVTAADLAQPGTLELAVKNVTKSNSVTLTVM